MFAKRIAELSAEFIEDFCKLYGIHERIANVGLNCTGEFVDLSVSLGDSAVIYHMYEKDGIVYLNKPWGSFCELRRCLSGSVMELLALRRVEEELNFISLDIEDNYLLSEIKEIFNLKSYVWNVEIINNNCIFFSGLVLRVKIIHYSMT